MSEAVDSFLESFKYWQKKFKIMNYPYWDYNCEVSEIVKFELTNQREKLIQFWNKMTDNEYFELSHPIYNNIRTRAVLNFYDGITTNMVFMIDSQNQFPWIFYQSSSLIDCIIIPGFNFIASVGFNGAEKWAMYVMSENIDKIQEFYFRDISFGFTMQNSRPYHFFFEVLNSFMQIKSSKDVLLKNIFYIPENISSFQTDEKSRVWIYPTTKGVYDSDFSFLNIKESQSISNEKCLIIWLQIPGEKRQWIDQEENIFFLIKELSLYFKEIKIYLDGMTSYEDEKKEFQENDMILSRIRYKITQLISTSRSFHCEVISLAGENYKNKIQYCSNVHFCINEAGTADIVPKILEKVGIIYYNGTKEFEKLATWKKKNLVVDKKYIFNLDEAKKYDRGGYIIPWQHVYNLAADILEQLSLDGKLKIKNLRMHRLDVPPVELLSRQYNLEQELKIKEEQIQSLNQKISTLELEIAKLTNTLDSLPVTKQNLEIKNLKQDVILKEVQIQEIKQGLINKQLQTKKLEKEIENEKNALEELQAKKQELEEKNVIIISRTKQLNQMQDLYNTLSKAMKEREAVTSSKLSFCMNYATAKFRIQNQLSYKLGQAMIANSKSLLGYIRMPFVLSYIKDKHKQEQKIYQEKIKKDPSLKLPPLESYPGYKEALKEKECLTYKLGEALIRANKTWYKGGYVRLIFEIRKLKKEFGKK